MKGIAKFTLGALTTFLAGSSVAGSAEFGPPPPPNPFFARQGLGSQHGDAAASDTSPLSGPGASSVAAVTIPLPAVCPSLLAGADGLPIAICTQLLDQAPVIYLLDRESGAPLASLPLEG